MNQLFDARDFEEYVRSRGAKLIRYAFLLCGDQNYAQDLTQEALLKASSRWNQLSTGAPDQYLRKVITNDFLSWKRSRASHEVVTNELESVASADPFSELVERDAMTQALASLRPRQRAVLVLRYYESRSDPDIAIILGCRPGTVRSLAARAFVTLRSHPNLTDSKTTAPTKAGKK